MYFPMNVQDVDGILGIAPDADEPAIRAAYAKKLKHTHPEDDPESFKALRNAYETALRNARFKRFQSAEAIPSTATAVDATGIGEELPGTPGDASARDADKTDSHSQTPQIEPEVAEHLKARKRFTEAIREKASIETLRDRLADLLQTSAMARIEIYDSTAAWLVDVVHRTRPVCDALVDPIIEFFKWETAPAEIGRWQSPQALLALRRWIDEERKAATFLETVADKRSGFHTAYQEACRPPPGDHENSKDKYARLRHPAGPATTFSWARSASRSRKAAVVRSRSIAVSVMTSTGCWKWTCMCRRPMNVGNSSSSTRTV